MDVVDITQAHKIRQNREARENLDILKTYFRLELYYQGLISKGFINYLEDLESDNDPLVFFPLDRSVDCVLNEHYGLSGNILNFTDKTC